jgi:hypothetical protein
MWSGRGGESNYLCPEAITEGSLERGEVRTGKTLPVHEPSAAALTHSSCLLRCYGSTSEWKNQWLTHMCMNGLMKE